MKAQEMPITTIVILIIGIVALVIIAIFFFAGFGQGREAQKIFTNISKNKTAAARCTAAEFGGCPPGTCCDPSTGECVSRCPP